jgi:hypothetical protein
MPGIGLHLQPSGQALIPGNTWVFAQELSETIPLTMESVTVRI